MLESAEKKIYLYKNVKTVSRTLRTKQNQKSVLLSQKILSFQMPKDKKWKKDVDFK